MSPDASKPRTKKTCHQQATLEVCAHGTAALKNEASPFRQIRVTRKLPPRALLIPLSSRPCHNVTASLPRAKPLFNLFTHSHRRKEKP